MPFRGSWRSCSVAAVFLCASIPVAARSDTPGPPFPRIANVYLHGAANPDAIPDLARWDVLVLDAVWTADQLRQLRQLNPNIKIYFYFCAYGMQAPPPPGNTWQRMNYEYAAANDLWWRNADGSIALDWPEVQMVNVTDQAPVGPWGTWRRWFAQRIDGLAAARPDLDGAFLDNFWRQISWQQGKLIHVDSDCNPTHNPAGCDGVADSPALLDSLWNRAMRDFAQDLRARFDATQTSRAGQRPLAILSNGASDYFEWLNGTLYESFPSGRTPVDRGAPYHYNWTHEMFQFPNGYLVAPFSQRPYAVQIVNSNWTGSFSEPNRSEEFERHKRFTLGSALLGDGYYSLDAGLTTGHGHLWWEPEYDGGGLGRGYLGYPLGPARRVRVPQDEEMVLNGSFGGSTLPWQAQAQQCTGDFRLDTSVLRSSPGGARLDVTSLAPGGSLRLSQDVPVLAGRMYTLRFWARAQPAQEVLVHLYSDACTGARCLSDRRFWVTSSWREYTVSFQAAGNAHASLNIFVNSPGTVWLDDVSLRLGDTSVFRRDFDRGVVLLNYTKQTQIVDLGGTFYRLRVPGSRVWDGAIATAEIVPPGDARILLRDPRPAKPTDAPPGEPPPVDARQGARPQVFPNPVAHATTIRFTPQRDERVLVAIYDVAGRRVRTLVNQSLRAGAEVAVPWDATDDTGRRVVPGIYLCRIETPTFVGSRKLVVSG